MAIVGQAALPAVARRIDLPKGTFVILVIGLRAIDLRKVLEGGLVEVPCRGINARGAVRPVCDDLIGVIHVDGLVKENARIDGD